jgi:hypothetical protein
MCTCAPTAKNNQEEKNECPNVAVLFLFRMKKVTGVYNPE